jgi:hypothetical protein
MTTIFCEQETIIFNGWLFEKWFCKKQTMFKISKKGNFMSFTLLMKPFTNQTIANVNKPLHLRELKRQEVNHLRL